MKQFFKYLLATVMGLFLFLFLVILIFAGIAATATKDKTAKVESNSVLKLDLNYNISEVTNENPFSSLGLGNMKPRKAVGLYQIREVIKKAAKDDNIKGIYLPMGLNDNGYATLEALRDELIAFRKSGKFVYAYGEIYSQKAYYLATAADKIYLNPHGGMELKGFGREISYFKNMFDRLGVEVQDFHCGQFKSAIEPFVRNNMTESNREQLMYLYSDIYNRFLTNISSDRKIDRNRLDEIINGLEAESPVACKELKLVDELSYYDEVVAAIKKKTGVESKKDQPVVELDEYATTLEKDFKAKEKIAVLVAEGDIVDGEGEDGEIGGESFAKQISKLRKDDKVKAIVLRVNSPGGSALASEVMWRELYLAKTENNKPLIVSFGDVAASGGYYISCVADKIYAQPNSITGSIGVFGLIPNARKMFDEKLGVTFDEVKVTRHGVLGGITKPLDAEESAITQRSVERVYREFKERVAEGRNKDTSYIETIAQGRVWTGTQAIENGLVDELGGLDEAIAFAAEKANAKEYRVKIYPEEKSLSQKLSEAFGEAKASWVKEQLGEQYNTLKTIQRLQKMKGIQMRMPYEVGL